MSEAGQLMFGEKREGLVFPGVPALASYCQSLRVSKTIRDG